MDSVKDDTPAAQDATPLAAERQWQQQAEDNVVERLQRAGLLAPEGDVDKVLQTVVNNLEITNNIELPASRPHPRADDFAAGDFQRRQYDRTEPGLDRRASR